MASFAKVINNSFNTNTYQGTKNTYDWIVKAIHKGDFPGIEIKSEILFDLCDINCSCKGIEEFVENAYGQTDYELVSLHISVYSEDKSIAYLSVNSFGRIRISTDSRGMLEKIVNLLENTSLDEAEANDPISVTYIETQINNDGVIVHGNQNNVANNHSEIEIEQEKGDSGVKSFLSGILQNIASNFLWYLLTLVAGGVLTYLATN